MHTLLLALLSNTALASPITLHHTVRLIDGNGQPLNDDVAVAVALFTSDDGTGQVFRQDFGTLTVQDGYLSVALDTNTADQMDLDSSLLDQSLWVGTEVDSELQLPLQPLVEVPRAGVVDGPVRPDTAASRCVAADPSTHGWMRFDATLQTVLVCTNQGWTALTQSISIVETNGVKAWSDGSSAASCEEYRHPTRSDASYAGDTGDGVYAIDPEGDGSSIDVTCDMTTAGGGWTKLLDFDRATEACPSGLVSKNVGTIDACSRNVTSSTGGEAVATVAVGFPWQEARVQGTIWADNSPEAFGQAGTNRGGGIDGRYADGVGLTTTAPRAHIFTWTLSDNASGASGCPAVGGDKPAFVGSDFLCSFSSGTWQGPFFATTESTVTLAAETSQDIEIRVMSNQPSSNEELAFSELLIWLR